MNVVKHETFRRTKADWVRDYFHCSQTLRRLAWEARREALKWESAGNLEHYRSCRRDSDRLWNGAKWNLEQARNWRLT